MRGSGPDPFFSPRFSRIAQPSHRSPRLTRALVLHERLFSFAALFSANYVALSVVAEDLPGSSWPVFESTPDREVSRDAAAGSAFSSP